MNDLFLAFLGFYASVVSLAGIGLMGLFAAMLAGRAYAASKASKKLEVKSYVLLLWSAAGFSWGIVATFLFFALRGMSG